ncbi:zinc-binding protein A33-like [Clinocottus analis]|uniref:zinc-binding protein A33-like n=1 Tax=Clinocottus analis TaxID=304258 RepID=UPI0035C0A383
MAASASPSEMECSCPVCCDIFNEPVVLLCGHSFCKDCLQEWWRKCGLQTCPVCKETFPMAQPPRNLALRNLSDALRQGKILRANSASQEICSLHSEKFKLFCREDRQLICVICRDAQKHKKHNCVPIEEAVKHFRAHLKLKTVHLKTKLGTFEAQKLLCNEMSCHIKLQAQQTEKMMKEEFQKLQQFLQTEEAARIGAVRREANYKSRVMDIRVNGLTAEISSLSDKIKAIERDMTADDISFMLNAKSLMERSQCSLPDPVTPSGALLDEAKHVGNLLSMIWAKMTSIFQYTPVTLDPNTSGSGLTISEHMTRLTKSSQPLPENPERLGSGRVLCSASVLGSKGFISGKHSWDVEVGDYWKIGVAARNHGPSSEKAWGIYMRESDLSEYAENNVKPVYNHSFPKKVKVHLDYDQGILSFLDLDNKTLLHAIECTFTEMVFPHFSENAKILPSDLSVMMKNNHIHIQHYCRRPTTR